MKKILFFIESLAGGGAEKVLADLVSNLDKQKYDITVYTVTDEDVYQEQVGKACRYRSFLHKENYRAGGIKKVLFWITLKLIYMLPTRIIYKLFIREKYDLEVAFIEGFATKFIAASTNTCSKKIAWVHTNMEKNTHADCRYKDLAEHRKSYDKFNTIVCVSEGVKHAFLKKFAKNYNVLVQYNPIDEKIILEKSKEEIDIATSHDPVLCTVGRLEEVKGFDRLLRCSKRLFDDGLDFELWIIGDGTQKGALQKYICDNNLGDRIKLLGFQTNPYKFVSRCDAFICSSYEEGYSTAATESLILGKPIFTLECAGMCELFGMSNCGEIVENSEAALYGMMKQAILHKNEFEQYHVGVNNRASEFKIDVRLHEIDNFLQRL